MRLRTLGLVAGAGALAGGLLARRGGRRAVSGPLPVAIPLRDTVSQGGSESETGDHPVEDAPAGWRVVEFGGNGR